MTLRYQSKLRFLLRAIDLYREQFQPSEALAKPYVMVGANAIAADRSLGGVMISGLTTGT